MRIESVELSCKFSGEKPPQVGRTYKDQNCNLWRVKGSSEVFGILSDTKVWNVSLSSSSLTRGIPYSLNLSRSLSSAEIREARQKLQDMGFETVRMNHNFQHITVEGGSEPPEEIDGIPVVKKVDDIEDKIIKLIKYIESKDDNNYGIELLDTILYKLSGNGWGYRAGSIPEEHQEALHAFQSLPYAKQHNLVYGNVDAGPMCFGEAPGDRDLLIEE